MHTQGIVSYTWKLFSDHFVQPILENVDQPVLSVHGLLSGTYKFGLTVKDTGGQTASTTVILHVVKGLPLELIYDNLYRRLQLSLNYNL